MQITDDIRYVGVNDHRLDLFEGQYIVPDGMSYNSYVIRDEKSAVMDSVDAGFTGEWLANIEKELEGRAPDYIVISHMEPDHSGSLKAFIEKYPDTTVVGHGKAFVYMKQFYGVEITDKKLEVAEGSELNLGKHSLRFFGASMIHWPEVIMSYDTTDRVLFSADAFGKFGALDHDDPEGWACEARRYYFGIVGKYGNMVQGLLKKLEGLEIRAICPLHGPVLDENIGYYIRTYDTWSAYRPEDRGVFIAYTSVYGNTKAAAELLADELRALGVKVSVSDLARDDMAEAVEDAFRYDRLVLATTTYNGDIFPYMRTFVEALRERSYQNRTVAFIENGTWAPQAARIIRGMLSESKNITEASPVISIKSGLTEENREAVRSLAKALNT